MTVLPLAPEYVKTDEKSLNKTIELFQGGEFTILKGLALREITIRFLLPKDSVLTKMTETEFKEPIFYLAKFREFIENKKPIRLTITRTQQKGDVLFAGNILVSFEEYEVLETQAKKATSGSSLK